MSITRRNTLAIIASSGLFGACASDEDELVTEAPACVQADADQPIDSHEEIQFATAKLLIEHNATEEDTGFQGFVDGEPWKRLEIYGPDGRLAMSAFAHHKLRRLGLTELFFETNEPPNAEIPIPELLESMPAGRYELRGRTVDGIVERGFAMLSHQIPAGPEVVLPADDATVNAGRDLVFQWRPVTKALDGTSVTITHYQLIVNRIGLPAGPGFGAETMSIHVPATIRRLRVPHELIQPGAQYEWEVMAIAANGNQTFSEGAFAAE